MKFMENLPENVEKLFESMVSKVVNNYIVPGLKSSLLDQGKLRMFEASRLQLQHIVPHSHRFDFGALVIRGSVLNTVFVADEKGDEYAEVELVYSGKFGTYSEGHASLQKFSTLSTKYGVGDWYGMHADEIHRIEFSRDARVLFFEGPEVRASSKILKPVVDGEVIDTFTVQDWMFKELK